MATYGRISFITLAFYLFILLAGGQLFWTSSYQQQQEANQARLKRFSDQLNDQLEKYAYIPRLLSKDSELIDALTNPDNSAQIDITNRYLADVNQIIEASDTYLLNVNGTTIAASNWQSDTTFIGRNFAFRPYFQQAMLGGQGQYFALGSTSGKRGFYYAYPVSHAADILGVIVVKTNLSDIEAIWLSRNSYVVVTDADNIVFMSSNPDWLFASLVPLSAARREHITQSQRYLDRPLQSLGFISDHNELNGELSKTGGLLFSNTFLSSRAHLSSQDLTVRVLSPKSTLLGGTAEFIVVITLLLLCWQLLRSRQRKQRQIEQIKEQAKQKLEFQVMARTAELQVEIRERAKTEKMLMQTQEELIQAAKLAVLGEMSASISHELNNPLAAIRSFAENGRRFLEKGQPERTSDNLTRISALTDRMAAISQQLKSFARKTGSDELINAGVQPVLASALELIKARLRSAQVNVETSLPAEPVTAKINPIQLEQVIINLLTNAIEAMADSPDKQLFISLSQQESGLELCIEDSGCGVSKEHKARLFEPFYTTKKNGLGLGLSISHQIMQGMGGNLDVEDSLLGGARFVMTLAASSKQSA